MSSRRPTCSPRSSRPQHPLSQEGAMASVVATIRSVAATDLTILLQGETGVGKELVAREIHACSQRRDAPFVKVHCAALPAPLFESEILGHERGAFTGAVQRQCGRFERAHGGTLFLDEIGELPLALQAKLLQVIEDRSFQRVGGNETIGVDVRIVCASNRSLEKCVADGAFRQDLYFRILGVTITVPPLRERRAEIPLLLRRLLQEHARALGKPAPRPSPRLFAMLRRHPFPGNVRELDNLARRFVIRPDEDAVARELLEARRRGLAAGRPSIDQLVREFERSAGKVPLRDVRRRIQAEAERELIARALIESRCNRRAAAQLLRVGYSTLLGKIEACGLEELAHAATIGRTSEAPRA
ncbi:MAG: hypothetical protein DCC71_15190 [Proteobacteria bacterium]|nr:MAG: hypothetical protein DCC71_15190 [Pseudomonadota bacterium]